MMLLLPFYGILVIISKFHLVGWVFLYQVGERVLETCHMLGITTINEPNIASLSNKTYEYWNQDILFITGGIFSGSLLNWFIIFYSVTMIPLLFYFLHMDFSIGEISCKMSLLITRVTSEIWVVLLLEYSRLLVRVLFFLGISLLGMNY